MMTVTDDNDLKASNWFLQKFRIIPPQIYGRKILSYLVIWKNTYNKGNLKIRLDSKVELNK